MTRPTMADVAEELGYTPHQMARSLAGRTATVLGVMVSDLRNAFFVEVVEGIDAAARAEGFEMVLTTIDQPRAEMGRLATQALFERVRGNATTPSGTCSKPSLVVRASTAAPPASLWRTLP